MNAETNTSRNLQITAHQEAINTLAEYPAKAMNGGPDAYSWAEYALDRIIAAVREAESGVAVGFCGDHQPHPWHKWTLGQDAEHPLVRKCGGYE